MKLWTIQSYEAYEILRNTGVLRADKNYIFDDNFCYAYKWIIEKMQSKSIILPKNVEYPIWAWYQWEGKHKRLDMRQSGYATRGEKIVQLTIEIDSKDVLLSDFDLFHYVLNYWYLAIDEEDDRAFELEYKNLGFEYDDLKNLSIQNESMRYLRNKIENSWNNIFDLEKEDEYIYGRKSQKSIQATFGELKLEQVVKSEIFIAK
ncbi:MAG: DUF3841 domain-containing protein [Proteocatella sp.]